MLTPHPAGTVQSLKPSAFPKSFMKGERERASESELDLLTWKNLQHPITEREQQYSAKPVFGPFQTTDTDSKKTHTQSS